MPQIFWGNNNPTAAQTNNAAVGDIFISLGATAGFPDQRRRNTTPWGGNWAACWDVIVPPDTRGDVAPEGGQLNDRLALIGGGRLWEMGWANAAEGVVGPPAANNPGGVEGRFDQTIPSAAWQITHNLSSQWVDVTVISPGATDPTAPQTILVPEVEYVSTMICRLEFVDDVVGTAIIRR